VFFIWQDPQGRSRPRNSLACYLDVNSLYWTPHRLDTLCLDRIKRTDVWLGTLSIDSHGEVFIPFHVDWKKHQLPGLVQRTWRWVERRLQRAWWWMLPEINSTMIWKITDVQVSGWGYEFRPLHLPHVPLKWVGRVGARRAKNIISAGAHSNDWLGKKTQLLVINDTAAFFYPL